MGIERENKVPVKRKSRGRSKGSKGKSALVQCSGCGELVPRDKAKKVSRRVSMVDYALAKELRQKGAYIASPVETRYYCVSCAVHRGVVKVRARDERKQPWRRH
jgi:small subunit ribosomal protein S26e